MVRPTGDALTGYAITKSQEELFGILNETRLYQSGKYIDDRARYFARFFFNGLTDKSQQIVLDKLIEDELNENQPEKEQNQPQVKKSGKNRRRRKNKNKNENSANTKDGKSLPKKGKNQGKGNKPKTYNMMDEEEKKLTDQLTMTEDKSSKFDNDENMVDEAIHDLQGISLYPETKSECDKEDEHKLEKDVPEEIKLMDADRLDPALFTKGKSMKVDLEPSTKQTKITSSMSQKDSKKIDNARTQHSESGVKAITSLPNQTPSPECSKAENKEEYIIMSSPKSNLDIISSGVVSIKSDEKYTEPKIVKTPTNPTSESSSIKCSSVTSRGDKGKVSTGIAQHNIAAEETEGIEWTTSTNKKRNNKGKKNQKNKKNKQTKAKAKPAKGKDKKESVKEEKKGPDSIWDQSLEQNVLNVPEPQLEKSKTYNTPSQSKTQFVGKQEEKDQPKEKKNSDLKIKMTQEKKVSKTPQKNENDLIEGPPKFFNSKVASKDSQGSEKLSDKSSESSIASSIGKKNLQGSQKKNSKKNKKTSDDSKNTQKTSQNMEETKVQQTGASEEEMQKHANKC
jgi:hypothetical protein